MKKENKDDIKILKKKFPEISRSFAKKLIDEKIVEIVQNEISFHKTTLTDFIISNRLYKTEPQDLPIKLLFEDEDTLLVEKPSGIVTHHDQNHIDNTLENALSYHAIYKLDNPFCEIKPVHRLDKATSGLILCSKNNESHAFYSRQFKKREIEKTYVAIVKGDFGKFLNKLSKDYLEIESFISKEPKNFRYFSTNEFLGDLAITFVYFEKYLDKAKNYSLVKVVPQSGRTHQIRVHLSEAGFPILGDETYGGDRNKRMMLHAWKLKYRRYSNQSIIELESALPQEFKF